MARLGITNEHVNTNVTSLQTPEWDTLLQRCVNETEGSTSADFHNLTPQRIGVESMVHLLADTSIFVSLPNDCYCQMTGKIILYLAPSFGIPAEKSATSKRPLEFTSGMYEQRAKRVKLSSINQPVAERCVVIAFIT